VKTSKWTTRDGDVYSVEISTVGERSIGEWTFGREGAELYIGKVNAKGFGTIHGVDWRCRAEWRGDTVFVVYDLSAPVQPPPAAWRCRNCGKPWGDDAVHPCYRAPS